MPRAVPKKAASNSPARRLSPRKEKTPAPQAIALPPAPPLPPPPTREERLAALLPVTAAARQRLWAGAGSVLGKVGEVFIHGAGIKRGRPHWHVLTEGLGVDGFELSLRVQREKEEVAPPAWVVTLASTLITRVTERSLQADTNQVLLLSEGVAPGTDSELGAVIFTPDPEQGVLETKLEKVPLLLAVPITREEARTVREWSPSGLVEVLARLDPLLISWLDRPSLLSSPRARQLIEQRLEREGSSLSTMTAETSDATKSGELVTWRLSADAVETLASLLKGRVAHQRPFSVVAGEHRVEVVNGDPPSVELEGQVLTLRLTLVAARQIRSLLRPRTGTYTFDALPNFALTVV